MSMTPNLGFGGGGKRQFTLQSVVAALLGGTGLASSASGTTTTPLNLFLVPLDPVQSLDGVTVSAQAAPVFNDGSQWQSGVWAT